MFSFQVKPDSKPYQAAPRPIAYVLQKPFKEELKRLQQQDITTLLGMDEMAEWCNSYDLVPKPNGKLRLCLDLAKLNHALTRPVHRGSTLNEIFPKLNNLKYVSLIDVSPGYHNIKLDKRSSYLTTFAGQFGRYRYKRMLFGAAPTGNMFQWKIKIFKHLPNVFGIADDILVVGYDSDDKDHDEMLWHVLQICRHVNLKTYQRQMALQVYTSPICWRGDFQAWSTTQPTKAKNIDQHAASKDKKGTPSISWYN